MGWKNVKDHYRITHIVQVYADAAYALFLSRFPVLAQAISIVEATA